MLEPTYQALCYSGTGSLSNVGTYLPGTVLQWCRLFKQFQNLPTGHCVTEVQTVWAVSVPTCWALCYSGAGCLSNVRTYLQGNVLQWYRLFKQCQNLPTGHCVTGLQTVELCRNLPAGHCVSVVQAVFKRYQNLLGGHCVAGLQTV